MRIFVTGATGFIGSAITADLLAAGHQVLGLARSDAAAERVTAAGAKPHRGDLEDIASLRAGAKECDAVIHTGFVHDFTRFKEVCEIDRRAIAALGEELAGTERPMLVSSGVALPGAAGDLTEATRIDYATATIPRVATEMACDELVAQGLRVGLIRFAPTVHGPGDHGFVAMLVDIAKKSGVAAYIADGANQWPAVHRLDAARLARLAIEHPFAPGQRFHAVAEAGVPFRAIAEAIGRGLGLPAVSKSRDEAPAHFGWFAHFAALDRPASSKLTREMLGWEPTHPTLLADLDAGYYTQNAQNAQNK